MSQKKTKICCLPIAGKENPYQQLMMKGLQEHPNLEVQHGTAGKFFAFLKTIRQSKPDYIHVDWLHQYYLRRKSWMTWLQFPLFVLEVILITSFTKTKLVWTLHNLQPHDQPYYGPYKWARHFWAKHCTWIRVFHEGTAQKASQHFKIPRSRFQVIPEGSYVGVYPNECTKTSARQKIKIKTEKAVFLFLGGVRPYKGIEDLITTFQAQPDKHLVIAGNSKDPNYKQKIKTLVAPHPNIECHLRFIPDEELQFFFAAADVIVLPFKKVENSGSAILAMGFQKAIVAPRMGVLTQRLSEQLELLYEDKIEEVLQREDLLNPIYLQAIGQRNFKALLRHKWADFGTCFRQD